VIEMEREKECIVIVGHQAILRALLGYFTATPPDKVGQLAAMHCSCLSRTVCDASASGRPGHPPGYSSSPAPLHCPRAAASHPGSHSTPAACFTPHPPPPTLHPHTVGQRLSSATRPCLQIPRLEIPLHTLMELRPRPDGTMEVEFIPVAITTPKEAPGSHVGVPHHLPDPDAPVQVSESGQMAVLLASAVLGCVSMSLGV
jgi:hypothetical protein